MRAGSGNLLRTRASVECAGNLPYRASAQEWKRPSACQVDRLQQRVQLVDTTSRPGTAMNINKQYAWQSGANSRENNPLLPGNF